MPFEWSDSPTDVFWPGLEHWQQDFQAGISEFLNLEEPIANEFLQSFAPWKDTLGGEVRRGLFAYAWTDFPREAGITASYSVTVDPSGQTFRGFEHETMTFKDAGRISIILPNPNNATFLGDYAFEMMDRLRSWIGDVVDVPRF